MSTLKYSEIVDAFTSAFYIFKAAVNGNVAQPSAVTNSVAFVYLNLIAYNSMQMGITNNASSMTYLL